MVIDYGIYLILMTIKCETVPRETATHMNIQDHITMFWNDNLLQDIFHTYRVKTIKCETGHRKTVVEKSWEDYITLF